MHVRLARADLSTSGLHELGQRWRALEASADASVFQSWTWVGCQAAERFDDPFLLDAVDATGATLALALLNRRRCAAWLHETGDPALDAPFIERNGPLVARGHDDLLPRLMQALPRRLVLSGVGDAVAAAARPRRATVSLQSRLAPVLDLRRPLLDSVSANTRSQLRRARRRHEEGGALSVHRADNPDEAGQMLLELIELHAARWKGRGSPGAFADPRTVAFHLALIGRGVAREEVDLLRVSAGSRTVGLLYNLRHSGRVFAYQGGFDYAATAAQAGAGQMKPGLVCHAAAADWYRARGMDSYDFGAGDARYKRSLASRLDAMHWLVMAEPWSLRAGAATLRRCAASWTRSWRQVKVPVFESRTNSPP